MEVEEFSYFLFKVEGLAVGSPVFVGDCGAEGSFHEFYEQAAVLVCKFFHGNSFLIVMSC